MAKLDYETLFTVSTTLFILIVKSAYLEVCGIVLNFDF